VLDVSSDALMPTWQQYASTMVAEEFLVFSLKLMSGWYNVNICNLPELVNMG